MPDALFLWQSRAMRGEHGLQSLIAPPPLSLNRTSLFALPFVRGPYSLTRSHPAKFLFSCESSTLFFIIPFSVTFPLKKLHQY